MERAVVLNGVEVWSVLAGQKTQMCQVVGLKR